LDNCEHVVAAAARLVDAVLDGCPGVRVLATSRERLNVAGETAWLVPSLDLPPSGATPTAAAVEASGAGRLFAERARAVQPAFGLSDANAPAVAQVCRRLDGIPLALELAAARVRVLTPEQLAARLDDRFRLLAGGSRTAVPRQQTRRATVDWSHALLSEPERALLRRLAVFAAGAAGGFPLEAAEAVGAGPPVAPGAVLDLLAGLVDKSLVLAEARGAAVRYRLLETLRQYAEERLQEAGEAAAARSRHRDWYLALAEAAAPELVGRHQVAWLDRLEAGHDDLRAALAWSRTDPAGAIAGLRLAAALWRFWLVRGHYTEGRRWLEGAARRCPEAPPALRATALNGAGRLAHTQRDYAAARALHEEALALFRGAGDRPGIARALYSLAFVARHQGDYAAARARLDEVLALQRELGDDHGIGWSLHSAGLVARLQGDYAAARACLEEALTLQRTLGDTFGIAWTLNGLGLTARDAGDYAAARAHFEEGAALCRDLGEQRGVIGMRHNAGLVAYDQGDYAVARARLEDSLAFSRGAEDRQGAAEALTHLGLVARHQGDYAAARARLQDALALLRAVGDRPGTALALIGLGLVALDGGDAAAARAPLEEAVVLLWEAGDRRATVAALEAVARLAAAQGQVARAARLLGAAARLREAIGAPLPPAERADHDRTAAAARARLAPGAFRAAWAAGAALPPQEAIDEALAGGEAPARGAPPSPGPGAARRPDRLPARLTAREAEVLRLVAAGKRNGEIAAALVLSVRTVEKHVANAYAKIGARGRADAATYALRHGVLDPESGGR
jgi:predicted ATPase/DNA-binding CsgD family transcriptional regulator/Tfp pilus assembly protein PilF